MAVEWRAKKLVYVPIPKVACTTLKHVFYLLNLGHEYVHEDEPSMDGIHRTYSGTPEFRFNRLALYAAWRRIVVVRDPVLRFISAYTNRVLDFGELSDAFIGERAHQLKVPVNPDIHQFIEHFDVYRAISPYIQHHFQPQAYFIGSDLRAYTHVFRIEELDSLHRMLVAERGCHFEMPRLQGSTAHLSIDAISVRELCEIHGWYAGDYALLRGYYAFERVLEKRSSRKYCASVGQSRVTLKEILPPFQLLAMGSEVISDDLAIYTEGCSDGVNIDHHDTLAIETQNGATCLVSFEKAAPQFLILGESYEMAISADSDHLTKLTCFLRYVPYEGEPVYLGTTCMTLEPGHTDENVLLDTDMPDTPLPWDALHRKDLKLILMFESASGMRLRIADLKLSLASS